MFQRFVDHCVTSGVQYIPFVAQRATAVKKADGLSASPRLHYYRSEAKSNNARTWIICHGGGYDLVPYVAELDTFCKQLEMKKEEAYQVLSVEYPAQLPKERLDECIRKRYVEVVKEVIRERNLEIDPYKTVVMGRCLGGFAALWLTQHLFPPMSARCVVLSVLTPIQPLFTRIVGRTLGNWLIADQSMYRLTAKELCNIQHVACLHGCRDHLYPMKDVKDWLQKHVDGGRYSLHGVHNLGHDFLDMNNCFERIWAMIHSVPLCGYCEHIDSIPVRFHLGTSASVDPKKPA